MLEPTPPISGGEISAVNPQVVTERLKQVAQTGLDPDNRKRIIRSLPGHVQQKYENDRSYSLLDAVVESTLKGKKQIPHEERKKFADGLRESLEAAGIDITNPNIPLDSLTRAYLETGQSIDFSPPAKKAVVSTANKIRETAEKGAKITADSVKEVATIKADAVTKAYGAGETGARVALEKFRDLRKSTPSETNTTASTTTAETQPPVSSITITPELVAAIQAHEGETLSLEIGQNGTPQPVFRQRSVQASTEVITPTKSSTQTKDQARAFSKPNVFPELIQEVRDMPPIVTRDEIDNGPAFLRRKVEPTTLTPSHTPIDTTASDEIPTKLIDSAIEQPPSPPLTPPLEPIIPAPVEPASLAVEQRSQGDIDSLELENLEYEPVDVSAASAETTVNDALREPRGYSEEGLETADAEPAVQAQEKLTERLAEMEQRKQKLNQEQDSIKKDVETITGLALDNYEDRLRKLVGLADKKVNAVTLESFDAFAAEITEVLENNRAWNKETHDANLDAVKNALLTEIVHKAPKKTLPDWLDKKDLPDWLFLEEPLSPAPRELPDWLDLKEPTYVSEGETVQLANNSHEEFSTVQGKVNLRDQSSAVIQSAVGRFLWDESTNIITEDTSMTDIQNNRGFIVLTDSSHGFIDNNQGKVNLSGSSSVHINKNQDWLDDVHISEKGSVYIGSDNYSPKIVDNGILFIPPESSLFRINQEAINNTFSLTVPALENDLATASGDHRILKISGRTFAIIKAQGLEGNEQQKAIAVFEKRMVNTENGQEEKYIFLDGRKVEDKAALAERLKAKTRLEDTSEFAASIASLETPLPASSTEPSFVETNFTSTAEPPGATSEQAKNQPTGETSSVWHYSDGTPFESWRATDIAGDKEKIETMAPPTTPPRDKTGGIRHRLRRIFGR